MVLNGLDPSGLSFRYWLMIDDGESERQRQAVAAARIESASQQLEDPKLRKDAERILLEFKDSETACEDAKYILTHCVSPLAQFHAVLAFKESSLRQWYQTNPEIRRKNTTFVLNFLVEAYQRLDGSVVAQLLQAIAVLYKREWLVYTEEEKSNLFDQIQKMMQINPSYQLLGLKLNLSIVKEFMAEKSSAMSMPLEFHVAVRKNMEKGRLREIGLIAFHSLQNFIHQVDFSPQWNVVLLLNLELCNEILSWQFSTQHSTSTTTTLHAKLSDMLVDCGNQSQLICPGFQWHDLLVQPELLHTIFGAYTKLRSQGGNDELTHTFRQLMISLACLHGDVFTNDQERVSYLSEVFKGAIGIMAEKHANPLEIVDMCQLTLNLVHNLRLKLILTLLDPRWFLKELSSLCCNLLRSALESLRSTVTQSDDPDDDPNSIWQLTAFEHLLDGWQLLLNDSFLEKAIHSTPSQVDPMLRDSLLLLRECTCPILELYVEVKLAVASRECDLTIEENDEIEEARSLEDSLEAATMLARINAEPTLQYLNRRLTEISQHMQNEMAKHSNSLTSNLSKMLEQLGWLVTFVGCVLADPKEGENPTIPPSIHHVSWMAKQNAADQDMVVLLPQTLFHILDLETKRLVVNPNCESLSPHLSSLILKTLDRWTCSYLLPDRSLYGEEGISDSIATAFGGLETHTTPTPQDQYHYQYHHHGGKNVVDFLIQQTSMYLAYWPTQPAVITSVLGLLRSIANVNVALIVIHLPSWCSLANSNATSQNALAAQSNPLNGSNGVSRLSAEFRGMLTEILLRGGMTKGNENLHVQYFEQVACPIERRLQELLGQLKHSNFMIQEELLLLIEMYRGVARSTEISNYKIICQFCVRVLPVMVKLFDLFHSESQIVCAVLGFFCDLVESQITYLPGNEALDVYNSCGELMKSYSKHNLNRFSIAGDAEEESYSHVLSFLHLLSLLISKDFIDFSEESVTNTSTNTTTSSSSGGDVVVAVADVVFFGLGLMIPLMTEQLLQYPSLCKHYFTLVTFMIEVYPERFVQLESSLFTSVMTSISFGIGHLQIEIARLSLQALAEVSNFHFKEKERGHQGLDRYRASNNSIFMHFIQMIFRFLVVEDNIHERLDFCANALFPLILCEQENYLAMAQEFSSQQRSLECQQRLLHSFQALVHDNQLVLRVDRVNRGIFRRNLKEFVAETRGFIRMK